MLRVSDIVRRVRAFSRRSRMAQDLDEEMRLHVELREARLRQASASGDAAAAARRRFGNTLRHRETAMDVWGWRGIETLGQDIRFALRTLMRRPLFATLAIGTMALGIGATAAVFSLVSGIVLRPLPFADPDRLV
jgi:hypothetical protein